MSWFSGEKIVTSDSSQPYSLGTADLPRLRVMTSSGAGIVQSQLDSTFGPHSLMDYFGVRWPLSNGHVDSSHWPSDQSAASGLADLDFNIFPFLAYQLCYHHWYRNKVIQRPLFAPPSTGQSSPNGAYNLPFISSNSIQNYYLHVDSTSNNVNLLNGHLLTLRQRNYGYDYFTTALPSAQDGSPMTVSTSGGSFTISALRLANSLQQFAERNQIAGPDYIQTLRARYNKAPSSQVAQRPILLGSADFPMFTSGVEQTSGSSQSGTGNPFAGLAARYGRAHAEGSDFVCEFECDEPAYLMVMCSLVPEANYSDGFAHDMRIFTKSGSITDLPCAELERTGMEPILMEEVLIGQGASYGGVFGYQPRYMWHKAGAANEVHGLFRKGASLAAFIPQRSFSGGVVISDGFLTVKPTDLDNVTAVSGAISQYGVMIDSKIDLFISEPLGESVMPSLVDPGAEHGQSVYVSRGGISVNS